MTRRAHPKPRWLRYQGRHGWVNERADDKAQREAIHRDAVKAQQAAGLESQAKRNKLPVRKRTPQQHAPDVTDFGPPRRRPGRMKVRAASKPAQAVYRPGLGRNASGWQPAKYFKPNIIKSMRVAAR